MAAAGWLAAAQAAIAGGARVCDCSDMNLDDGRVIARGGAGGQHNRDGAELEWFVPCSAVLNNALRHTWFRVCAGRAQTMP